MKELAVYKKKLTLISTSSTLLGVAEGSPPPALFNTGSTVGFSKATQNAFLNTDNNQASSLYSDEFNDKNCVDGSPLTNALKILQKLLSLVHNVVMITPIQLLSLLPSISQSCCSKFTSIKVITVTIMQFSISK